MIAVYLSGFWFTMVVSQVAFKLADAYPQQRWPIFLAGALVGIAGTWFMMALHGKLSAHLVVGLCIGGGFVLSQLAMSLIQKQLNTLAIFGSLIVGGGIAVIALASARPASIMAEKGPAESTPEIVVVEAPH